LQFTKESGNKVDEVKLRVLYVAPPQPPSPVPEESEEGSSPRASEGQAKNLTRYATVSFVTFVSPFFFVCEWGFK
jgi:hypothetical protein